MVSTARAGRPRSIGEGAGSGPTPWEDEGIVLGALVSGSLKPADVEGWAPAPGFGDFHRRLFFALLASLAVWGRVDLRRVLAYLGTAAGAVDSAGRCRGYLPELARRAPRRGGARLALGRLLYAAGLESDRRAEAADKAHEEVEQRASAAKRARLLTMPALLRSIREAGGEAAFAEALAQVPADERERIAREVA